MDTENSLMVAKGGGAQNRVYLSVAKILKILITKKFCNCVMLHVNKSYCDDHFTVYINTELFYTTIYVNYLNV